MLAFFLHYTCRTRCSGLRSRGSASEVEVQEELQELEAAEQVEEQEFDLANPDPQPRKHRKH